MTNERIAQGTISTGLVTVYTAASTVIVKTILLCNVTTGTVLVRMSIAGKYALYNFELPPRQTLSVVIDVIMVATETITVIADTADSVDFFISAKVGV